MLTEKRWKHFAAMVLIGDGVMAMTVPKHDARAWLWTTGPEGWQKMMRWFIRHPVLTRAMGAAEIAAGICWALHSEKD